MKKNSNSKCPSGKIWRRAYSRSRGSQTVKVPGNCIRSVSQSKMKRTIADQEFIRKREKLHKEARRIFKRTTPSKCPRGMIEREGYYRRSTSRKAYTRKSGQKIEATNVSGAWVPPACAPSINREKKQRLFVLEKDVLKKYGYHNVNSLTIGKRRSALSRALSDIEPLPLYRRVNALYVLQKNTNPALAAKFKEDAEWIKTTKKYQERPTARSKSGSKSKSRSRSRSKLGSK